MGRNYALDILKFVCAVLVVILHIQTPWTEYVLPITRAAVPCFFIISGYLIYQEDERILQRVKRSFVKVGIILLWSTVLYALFKAATSQVTVSYKEIVEFILFNVNPFGYHLWYLAAYMYVLAIFYVCVKGRAVNLLFIVSPLLLLADLVFGKYSLLIFGQEFNYIYLRNFLFVGIPYFSIGVYVKKIVCGNSKIEINKFLLLGAVFLFSFTSLLEWSFLERIELNTARDHYISTLFLSVSLFLLAISLRRRGEERRGEERRGEERRGEERRGEAVWVLLGAKYSLYIYVLHPLVDYCFKWLNVRFMLECWNGWIYKYGAPFIVLISTILIIAGWNYVKERVKIKKCLGKAKI